MKPRNKDKNVQYFEEIVIARKYIAKLEELYNKKNKSILINMKVVKQTVSTDKDLPIKFQRIIKKLVSEMKKARQRAYIHYLWEAGSKFLEQALVSKRIGRERFLKRDFLEKQLRKVIGTRMGADARQINNDKNENIQDMI